ncbi:GNAT family N-acetyltransferase [Deefgea rivuli]|uniref:GNAT family N-acetyltransferase n=1 Tax=Deefgea rivuli TaxID=400948 RepID=UPI00048230B7|nr:N-acetyltransferase [Deefgea rivuli]
MELSIQVEQAADVEAVENLMLQAFANHPHSNNQEYKLVNALRVAGACAVALLAKKDGALCGAVYASLIQLNGVEDGWYCIAPVAVSPAEQKQGIGQALMRAALHQLQQLGAKGCVIVGDPAYYSRFGFARHEGLVSPGIPDEYVMGLAFADAKPQGRIDYHAAFLAMEA